MELRLLGRPRLHRQDQAEDLAPDKPALLLCYLAYRADWVSRDELAFLFWPDEEDFAARRNLRQLLHRARALEWAQALEVEPRRLGFRLETDVRQFRDAIGRGAWGQATALYRGPLLEGVQPVLAGYEAWLSAERDALYRSWREAALSYASSLGQGGRQREAAQLLQRVWRSDPLDEEALRAYLRSAYESGSREQALAAYAEFERQLRAELELEPLAETAALAAAIRSGRPLEAQAEERGGVRLPPQATPFIGRRAEVAEVKALLRSDCRFLVLTGPGGVGKTRLALQVASEEAGAHRHGVAFVSLVGVSAPEGVVPAIAEALGFSFYGEQAPEVQLADYLRAKERLLVLDTFEHLKEAAALLVELLEQAPEVKLLATSRERLPLASVWHQEVRGLDGEGSESEAAQFFALAARRTSPRWRLADDERPYLQKLCQLVSGLPLALELAAAWVGQLSLRDVYEEVQHNLDLLRAAGREGGMRAVFESSWALLSPEEQRGLAGLSVFRGGFSRDAAEQVAGASLYLLLSLVGKSLLNRAASGRYELHDLLRQFAAEKLAAQVGGEAVLERHASYFAAALKAHEESLRDDRQLGALAQLSLELGNIGAAWRELLERGAWERLLMGVKALGAFYSVKGLHREGARVFSQLVERASMAGLEPGSDARARDLLLGQALERLGWFLRQLGDVAAAEPLLLRALDLLERHDDRAALVACHGSLGALFATTGDFQRARACFGEAVELADGGVHPTYLANALNGLGNVERALGNLQASLPCYRRGLELAERAGNAQVAATLLCNLGVSLWYADERGEAEAATRRSRELAEQVGDAPLTAVCLANLAEFAFVQGDIEGASALRRQSLELRRDLGDREGEAFDIVMLGYDARRLEDFPQARRRFLEGLRLARAVSALPILLDALVGLADLIAAEGGGDRARAYLALALEHPATPSEARERAQDLWRRLEGEAPLEAGSAPRLEEVLGGLLGEAADPS